MQEKASQVNRLERFWDEIPAGGHGRKPGGAWLTKTCCATTYFLEDGRTGFLG
jgi:hypothetical protein